MQLKTADLLKEASPQVGSRYEGSTSELHALCLAPLEMDTFSAGKDIPFEKGAEIITVELPEGEYILYALVKVIGFRL